MPIDSLKTKVNRKEEERNEKNIAAALGAAASVRRVQNLLQTSPVPVTLEIQSNSVNPGPLVRHRESELP